MNWLIKHRTRLQQFFLLVIALNLLLLLAGCDWVTPTIDIIKVLIPGAFSLLGLLGTLGLPPAALTAFEKWSTVATSSLTTVQNLVASYKSAEASAQPGILGEIDSAINALLASLTQVLNNLQITDPESQAKWTAAITEWATELESLLNLLPVLKGEVADHDKAVALVQKVKSARKFAHDLNAKFDAFGPQAKKFHVKGPALL
jgi:hypothetical protein